MSLWKNTPIQDVIDELKTRGVPGELIDFIEEKQSEAKNKALLKHILPSLTADEIMKHKVQQKNRSHDQAVTCTDTTDGNNLSYDDCVLLFDYLNELKEKPLKKLECKSTKDLKIFNDPIHGHIQLHPACQMIVDTPQFQRLRDIKQLGTVYFVYPGAAHNRFEHSLGVCHLAGQFARALRESQPELGITDVDILCVEIAGLCRDLGHGPFSRLYINKFLPAVDKKEKYRKPSAKMFKHLVQDNKLKEKLEAYGILEQDIKFIEEQLQGTKPTGSTRWPFDGRPKEKAYLYEIVVNNRNGIDVYKWDYLARDCHQLGIKNNFDASRYMKFARVIETEGEIQICIRDKEISNLYNMFYTRYTVNKFAYFHKVTCGIELMIVEALKKANKHVQFKGENNQDCSIYDCYKDMKAFTQLTDNVLFVIRNMEIEDEEPNDPDRKQRWKDLKEAKKLIKNIFKRKLFTCVYESPPMDQKDLPESKKVDAKLEDYEEIILNGIIQNSDLKKEDVIVKIINLHFGMKEENPVERLKVYSKHTLNEARHLKKEEASRILGPVKFYEVLVRVYSTTGRDIELIKQRAKAMVDTKKGSNQSGQSQATNTKKKHDLPSFSEDPTDSDGIPPVKKTCSQS